jgi:hypothetical protein
MSVPSPKMSSSRTPIAVAILITFSVWVVVLLYLALYVVVMGAFLGSGDELDLFIRTATLAAVAGLLSSFATLLLLLKQMGSEFLNGKNPWTINSIVLLCLSVVLLFLHGAPLVVGLLFEGDYIAALFLPS